MPNPWFLLLTNKADVSICIHPLRVAVSATCGLLTPGAPTPHQLVVE